MSATIINGNSLHIPLADNSVQMCVTSPPYFGLRDYGIDGQLGLEQTPDAYVANMVQVFREVWRVLKDDGTLWLNLGDSYASGEVGRHDKISSGNVALRGKKFLGLDRQQSKVNTGMPTKNLLGIPWRVAFALQADGWYLRQDIIWHKPNPMPESVTDRCTKAHEYIFLLSKSERYFYDAAAISEAAGRKNDLMRNDGDRVGIVRGNGETRNKRSVWTVATHPYSEAHFATFPPKLIEPCILAGSREGDIVLDCFNGAGTSGLVALEHNRRYVGIELNPAYIKLTQDRLDYVQPRLMLEVA